MADITEHVSAYYDDYETYVIDYDPAHVKIEFKPVEGTIILKLKRR